MTFFTTGDIISRAKIVGNKNDVEFLVRKFVDNKASEHELNCTRVFQNIDSRPALG